MWYGIKFCRVLARVTASQLVLFVFQEVNPVYPAAQLIGVSCTRDFDRWVRGIWYKSGPVVYFRFRAYPPTAGMFPLEAIIMRTGALAQWPNAR
jgi:hypothetical protein